MVAAFVAHFGAENGASPPQRVALVADFFGLGEQEHNRFEIGLGDVFAAPNCLGSA